MFELFGSLAIWLVPVAGSVRGTSAFVLVATAFPVGELGEAATVAELHAGSAAFALPAVPLPDVFAVPDEPPWLRDVPGLAGDPACGAAGPVGLVLVGPPMPEAAPPLDAPAAPPVLPPPLPLCARARLAVPASSSTAIVAIECRIRGIARLRSCSTRMPTCATVRCSG